MNNRKFAEELVFEIKEKCAKKGKPVKQKELRYHDLEPLQKEIAVQVINSRYKRFYVCFIDLEKTHEKMVTGKHESEIQKSMIHNLLVSLDKRELECETVKVIMDKKLSIEFQKAIKEELQKHLETKKGVCVETSNSSREKGIQIADVIAGAFRAKLMKKTDLFEVDLTHVFQITIPHEGVYKTEKMS